MEETHYPPPGDRLAILAVVCLGAIVTMIDTTIANVALPHMRASLGATQDQISWVLTSYIVATAVVVPATGFLEHWIGRRALFSFAILGFTISSTLCGMAWSLPTMVFARILQGLFGAVLSPMGQAILYDTFPPPERPRAITIWSMGVMVAPVLGPTLGGWLTDAFGWRWVFFINLPIGLVGTVGAWIFLPKIKLDREQFDWFGYLLIVTSLCSIQLMLDRGSELDWFNSNEIWFELALGIASLWMFIVHMMTARNPLIPPKVFSDRNFVVACVSIMYNSGAMMAGAALIAPLLQTFLGYGTTEAGFLMTPRAIAMSVSMLMVERLTKRFGPRLVIAVGIIIGAYGQYMLTGLSPDMDARLVVMSNLIQGFGLGFVFLPITILGYTTLAPEIRTYGASVFALSRSYGASIMIAVSSALIAHNVQVNHSELAANLDHKFMSALTMGAVEQFGVRGSDLLGYIDIMLNRQAYLIAYIDIYYIMSVFTLLSLVMVLFTQSGKAAISPAEALVAEAA